MKTAVSILLLVAFVISASGCSGSDQVPETPNTAVKARNANEEK